MMIVWFDLIWWKKIYIKQKKFYDLAYTLYYLKDIYSYANNMSHTTNSTPNPNLNTDTNDTWISKR